MNVKDLMSPTVFTVTPGHSIRHAAQIMLDHHVSGVPVVDAGELVGVLTEGDLLRRAEFGMSPSRQAAWSRANWTAGTARDFVRSHSWQVADVMSKPAVTVTEDAELGDVAMLLGTRGIKRLPVLRNGEIVGIISRHDLLKIVANNPDDAPRQGDEALVIAATARLRDAADLFASVPTVTAEHGVVHLWGAVRSEAERDAARVAVEVIHDIAGVEDHLTIERPLSAKPEGR